LINTPTKPSIALTVSGIHFRTILNYTSVVNLQCT
jgi:hypothetical protein